MYFSDARCCNVIIPSLPVSQNVRNDDWNIIARLAANIAFIIKLWWVSFFFHLHEPPWKCLWSSRALATQSHGEPPRSSSYELCKSWRSNLRTFAANSRQKLHVRRPPWEQGQTRSKDIDFDFFSSFSKWEDFLQQRGFMAEIHRNCNTFLKWTNCMLKYVA